MKTAIESGLEPSLNFSLASRLSQNSDTTQSPLGNRRLSIPEWKPWKRVPNAQHIADGLKAIPAHWSLTPLQDKSPRREGWQTEEFIPHDEIAKLILQGEERTSKKGTRYRSYHSGFGLRTGDASGGLLAIDVDGSSAQPLLEAISGNELPKTVSWTSGKPGRYQMSFQVPEEYREPLLNFNRAVLTEWQGLQTARDEDGKPTELLEFRYNRSQSCLPPSRHPTTGSYEWINSPEDTEVAIAPQWLLDLCVKFSNQEVEKKRERKERAVKWEQLKKQQVVISNTNNLVDFLEFEVLPRLDAEQIFNWSGHNFRQYGSTLKGNPPWRQSSSGTSFHVWWDGQHWAWQDKATGEGGGAVQYRWRLKGGSGTPKGQDFLKIVRELADDAGLQLPEFTREENKEGDRNYRTPTITRQEWESKHGWRDLVGTCTRKFTQLTKDLFSQPKQEYLLESCPAPTPAPGIFYFEHGDDLEFYQQPGNIFLNISPMGLGKSTNIGKLQPEELGVNQLIYASADHRNPTTAEIEQWTDIPARNDGMYRDDSQLTPMGNPYVRHPKEGEEPNIPGNCHKTKYFRKLDAKGWHEETTTTAGENIICNGCHLQSACAFVGVPGASFRFDRKEALKQPRIRGHLSAIPPNDGDKKTALIIDEASLNLATTFENEASLQDFDNTLMDIYQNLPELATDLQFLAPLRDLLLSGKGIHHGLNQQELLERIGHLPINLPAIIELLSLNKPDLEALIQDADSLTKDNFSWRDRGGVSSSTLAYVREQFRKDAMRESLKNLDNLPVNWLVPLLQILTGQIEGSFRYSTRWDKDKKCFINTLVIVQKDKDLIENIKSHTKLILLDATAKVEDIAARLEVDPNEILVGSATPPSHENMIITQVTGFGHLGERSPDKQQRVNALRQYYRQKYGDDVAFIDFLRYKDENDGHWFVDNRGCNRYQGYTKLVLFGVPYENLGHLYSQYTTTTGKVDYENEDFQRFVDARWQSEIIQGCGRLRSHLRPNEQLEIILVNDKDLTFLLSRFSGANARIVDAFELCPEAGTERQRTQWAVYRAMQELKTVGEKLTQSAIANLANINQSTVSRVLSAVGGYLGLEKLCTTLLDPLYRGMHKKIPLPDDPTEMVEQSALMTPGELLDEIADMVKNLGISEYQRLLGFLSPEARMKYYTALMSLLPSEARSQLTQELKKLAIT